MNSNILQRPTLIVQTKSSFSLLVTKSTVFNKMTNSAFLKVDRFVLFVTIVPNSSSKMFHFFFDRTEFPFKVWWKPLLSLIAEE